MIRCCLPTSIPSIRRTTLNRKWKSIAGRCNSGVRVMRCATAACIVYPYVWVPHKLLRWHHNSVIFKPNRLQSTGLVIRTVFWGKWQIHHSSLVQWTQIIHTNNVVLDIFISSLNVTGISECSASCGMLGTREKSYHCIQTFTHIGRSNIVDLKYCATKYEINTHEECREGCWKHTEWMPVSDFIAMN